MDLDRLLSGRDRTKAMADMVACMEEDEETDVCIIDCPPGFTATSVAAIAAATDVIIPIKLDAWSMEGHGRAGRSDRTTAQDQSERPGGRLPDHHVAQCRGGPSGGRSSGAAVCRCIPPIIRRSDKVDESTFAQMPWTITQSGPAPPGITVPSWPSGWRKKG